MPFSLSGNLAEVLGLSLLAILAIALVVKGILMLTASTPTPGRANGFPPPPQPSSFGFPPPSETQSQPAGQPTFFATTITPASNAPSTGGGTATATVPGHRAPPPPPRTSSGGNKGATPIVLIAVGVVIFAVTAYFAYGLWSDNPATPSSGMPVQIDTPNKLLGMKVAPIKSPVGQMVKAMKNEDIQGGFGTTAYAGYGDTDQLLVMMVAQSDHIIGTSDDYFKSFERAIEAEAQLDLHFHPVPAGRMGGDVRCAANYDPALAVCAWVNESFDQGSGIAGGTIFTGPIAKHFRTTILKVRASVEN